jgi:hypothetical protein
MQAYGQASYYDYELMSVSLLGGAGLPGRQQTRALGGRASVQPQPTPPLRVHRTLTAPTNPLPPHTTPNPPGGRRLPQAQRRPL